MSSSATLRRIVLQTVNPKYNDICALKHVAVTPLGPWRPFWRAPALCAKMMFLYGKTPPLIFYFSVSIDFDANSLSARTQAAVARATRLGYLRENTIGSVSGVPYHTNGSHALSVMMFHPGARKTGEIRLIMKGGVSENAGFQYALPDAGAKLIVIWKAFGVAFWMGYGRLRAMALAPA